MSFQSFIISALVTLFSVSAIPSINSQETAKRKIVLIAGEITKVDTAGHHDYLAGCECLQVLLRQTDGVETVQINDGWLNGIQFVDGMKGVTPLVWSGQDVEESRAGLDNHIVAWTYDRPAGGRSFSFSGLDAHSAWELPGMRQLVVNGILWSAGVQIPEKGAPSEIETSALDALTTLRESKKPIATQKQDL